MQWLDDVTRHLGEPTKAINDVQLGNRTRRCWIWLNGDNRTVTIDRVRGRYEARTVGPDGTVAWAGASEPTDEQMRVLCIATGILPMPAKED